TRSQPARSRRAQRAPPRRLLRRGRAGDGHTANGDRVRDDTCGGGELRTGGVRRVTATALRRRRLDGLGEYRVAEGGPRLLGPVAEATVGEDAAGDFHFRVDPEKSSTRAEVAEGAAGVAGARPVRGFRIAELE